MAHEMCGDLGTSSVLVLYEFLFFFLHLTMRAASSRASRPNVEMLQRYLAPLVASTAVDSACPGRSETLKARIRDEFYENMNHAELEYSTATQLCPDKNRLTGNSLFSMLARNAAGQAGDATNPAVLGVAMCSAMNAYADMELDSLVADACQGLEKVAQCGHCGTVC